MPQTPEQRKAAFAAAGVPLPATPQTSPIALDALSSPVTPLATVQTPPPAPLPKPPVAPAPQQPTDFVSQVESLTSQLAGKDAVTGARVKQASAQDRERLNQINYEINALNARAVQNQETVRQSGGDTSFQAGEAQRVARNDAIQGMFLAAQQQAILGNIALAEDTAKTAVDAEFATKEQELKTQRQNIIANYDTFTTDQKKRADAALLAIDKDDQFIKDQKESRQQLQTLALQLAANGVDASIIGQVQKAPSIEAAIKLAAPYVQSPEAKLKLKLLEAQIADTVASTKKKYYDIDEAKKAAQGTSLTPDAFVGTQSQAKSDVVNTVGKMKLNEVQAKSVGFVLRMIEANKAIEAQVKEGKTLEGDYDPTTIGAAIGRRVGSTRSNTLEAQMRNFIGAQLRYESGAAIPPEEIKNAKKIYSPARVTLTESEIPQYTANRRQAIESMIATAGPAAPVLKQYYDFMHSDTSLPQQDADVIFSYMSDNSGTFSPDDYIPR